MFNKLIIYLSDEFIKRMDEGKDGYSIISLSVPCKLLYELYERLSKIDVPPIESLPVEEKLKYFSIAKRFYETEIDLIKSSKAAYMVSIICNY